MAVVLVIRPWGLMGGRRRSVATRRRWKRRFAGFEPVQMADRRLVPRARGAAVARPGCLMPACARSGRAGRGAIRRQPAFHHGTGRHAFVRSRRLFGLGAYGAAILVKVDHADAARLRLRAAGGGSGCAGVRLVLRAAVGGLSGDAHARLLTDRLVGGVSMGRRHRRLQRHGGNLAVQLARRHELLLPDTRAGGGSVCLCCDGFSSRRSVTAMRAGGIRPCAPMRSVSTSSACSGWRSSSPGVRGLPEPCTSFPRAAFRRTPWPSASRSTASSWFCSAASRTCWGRWSVRQCLQRAAGLHDARHGLLASAVRRHHSGAGAGLPEGIAGFFQEAGGCGSLADPGQCQGNVVPSDGETDMTLLQVRDSQVLRRRSRRRWHQFRSARGRIAGVDRPERRRQIDHLQHGQRPAARRPADRFAWGKELVGRKPRDIWRLQVGRTFQIAETFASLTVVRTCRWR
jgi:hypothetical protein